MITKQHNNVGHETVIGLNRVCLFVFFKQSFFLKTFRALTGPKVMNNI